VQTGEFSIPGVDTFNLDIITAVDPTKSILFASIRENEVEPREGAVICELFSSTEIRCQRQFTSGGPADDITIRWYVVEFTSGVTVQRGTTNANSTANQTIAAVNVARSFVVLGGALRSFADGMWNYDNFVRAQLTSSTNLEIAFYSDQQDVHWQVVTFDTAAVQRPAAPIAWTDGSTLLDVTLPTAIDTTRSFLLFSYTYQGGGVPRNESMLTGRILNGTTLRFTRGAGVSGADDISLAYEVVSVPYRVQHTVSSLGAGLASLPVPLAAVNTGGAVAFSGNQAPIAQSAGGTDLAPAGGPVGVSTFTHHVSGPNTLTLTRTNTTAAADVGWFVIDFSSPFCCALSTTETATTTTITGAGQFELRFNTATGGGMDQFFDLAEDPTRTYDLVGGTGFAETLHTEGLVVGGVTYSLDQNTGSAKRDLLEATATRTRVRQEAFFQEVGGAGSVLPGLKAFADFSVYGSGRVAVRWHERATANVTYSMLHDLDFIVHRKLAGPLSSWVPFTESDGTFPNPGADDFLLFRSDAPPVRTDFLHIMHRDWRIANGHLQTADLTEDYFDSFYEFDDLYWREGTGATIVPGAGPYATQAGETWNFLTYFKPTTFADPGEVAVTSRSSDFRSPSAITGLGPGAQWQDASENTSAGGDFFNESEAAYVFDLDPTTGLTFDIDGGATTRYAPFFKIRGWRALAVPETVTVEGVTKTLNVEFRADVKPVTRAYSAEELRWHCTLEASTSCSGANLDVGQVGSTFSVSIVPGRYGNGALVDSNADYVSAGTGASGDFDPASGRAELWYKPSYNHDDGVEHALFSSQNGTDCFYFHKTAANELKLTIRNNGTSCASGGTLDEVAVNPLAYSWRANDWVHLAATWVTGQLRIFVDGTERAQTNTYDSTGMTHGIVYFGGCNGACPSGANANASGILDEIHIFNNYRVPELAHGGLGDYLGSPVDPADNYQFSLSGVDASRRGEYLYFGSESKFRGLNAVFLQAGIGVSDGALEWEYWNGGSWTNLETAGVGFTDETNSFKKNGTVYWTSDPPGWELYSLTGGPDVYFVRTHLANGEAYSTQAKELLIKTDILLFQYCSDVTAAAHTFVFGAPIPTQVTLASFSARGHDGAVELQWETASELDNLGFHLYRANTVEGPYQRLTASPIPGLGSSPAGARYRYVDSAVSNGTTYLYELEDIETTGRTERHGPVSATPVGGAGEPPPSRSSVELLYGDPAAGAVRVVERNRNGMILEVSTEGFEAGVSEDGSLSISIPGFEVASEAGSPAIPVKRAWLSVEEGRRVRIASVREESVERFASLRPGPAEAFEIVASRRGTVRAGRRDSREGASFRAPGLYPETAARILSVGYQGETKKALVELAPLRWDRTTGELVLTRKLRVRVAFSGSEPGARVEAGRRKRADPVVRLSTRERGLYAVTFEESLGGRAVRASSLRLSRQGKPVAFRLEPESAVFGPGSRLYFWSEGASLNPFGDEATYELDRSGGGIAMPRVPFESAGATLAYHWHRVEREENRYYQAALVEAPDLWLWDLLFAPVEKSYSFEIRELAAAAEPARVSLWLQGTSDFPAAPDHHLRVRVNEVAIAEAYLEGKRSLRWDADIPPGVLREGENRLFLENVGDTGAAYSMVMLNRFHVEYPRALTAEAGKLEGAFGERGEASIAGVSGRAHALDVTEQPARWLETVPAADGGLRVAVEPGRRYAVVDSGAVAAPAIGRAIRTSLRNESNRADYLVVGTRELLAAASPLLALRRTQGLSSRTASLEEIDSEFGYGERGPASIRAFLSYAYHHWRKPSPRYVLLLGDATYDFKDYLGTGVVNQMPAPLVKTTYLWTASDPEYAALNGDDILPDVALGRLPAASVQELRVMVEKIIAYETSTSSGGGRAVLVADNPDEAGDFEGDAEELASGILSSKNPERIYLRRLGPPSTTQAIVNALDSGASLLSYMGHGGIQLWAHENVFDTSRVGSLHPQAEQPVLLTMNCLNGYFHFPYFNSLSEELLKVEARGAVAAFSPSGLSLNEPAHLYHQALLRALVSGQHVRLGDAVLEAQESYADSGAFPELLRIYHLLGDPALKLR
jgi:hypothetical protein